MQLMLITKKSNKMNSNVKVQFYTRLLLVLRRLMEKQRERKDIKIEDTWNSTLIFKTDEEF